MTIAMSAVGAAKDQAIAEAVAELDAFSTDLAAFSKQISHWADRFNLGTPAFRDASRFVDSAWRNIQFARETFN